MAECVFDASFIAKANGSCSGANNGNLLQRRLNAVQSVTSGASRLRYNQKLLNEYLKHVQECRNDLVELFFEILDSDKAIRVKRSTLCKADNAKANDCRWPSHDQHILAAAIGGTNVVIYVTEKTLGSCGVAVKRIFSFTIAHID